jgi:glutaminase
MTPAGGRLLAEGFRELAAFNVTAVLSGIDRASAQWQSLRERTAGLSNIRHYPLLDDAIEWAEDQIIYRHGGDIYSNETTELAEQALLAGLSASELDLLTSLGKIRTYSHGDKIIGAGEPASSIFFLKRGVVHVKLPGGIRLATITAGMAFGEMALLETHRSADVFADASVTALEVPLADFERFRDNHPATSERIMRNLAQLLADRLIVANAKVNLLTAN